ncbi:DMT family transporter [Pseudomonas matsuisoli]|nr:DMT family transporter [Pseudomonas matsuisoli]
MNADRALAKGIGYGVGAGACWGIVFLGPALTPGLSGAGFAVLRFVCYGLIAVVLLAPRWRRVVPRLTKADWFSLFWLSLIGNLFYYSLVGTGVQNAGIATTSMIVGLIPVLVALAGRKDSNAVPLVRIAPALGCATFGVALISLNALLSGEKSDTTHAGLGLLCAFGALLSWSWFAVANARRLAVADVSSHDWSLLMGLMTGAQALLFAVPVLANDPNTHTFADWLHFLAVAAGVALIASIIGGALWNQASRLLPLALSGQVIVVEVIAALSFGFLWEQRFPSLVEIFAVALLVIGVVWCLLSHQEKRPTL